MALEFTKIPTAELEVFKKILEVDSIKVIFDVGVRNDIDMLEIHPRGEYHLFEPNPLFFQDLMNRLEEIDCNVSVGNFGLGDRIEERPYDPSTQSFIMNVVQPPLPIRMLDHYIKQHKVSHIDFLKIDTEGYDHRVLVGGLGILPKTKYIQYEHWDDKQIFHKLLEKNFHMEYIGYRNVLCINKRSVSKKKRDKIIKFIRDNKFGDLA